MSPLPAMKRRRTQGADSSQAADPSNSHALRDLLQTGQWSEALSHVQQHPEEAEAKQNPSPLALACRLGAPLECVSAILEACPAQLRCVIDARGTPIHEAIVSDSVGACVIETLLRADEAMSQEPCTASNKSNSNIPSTRATLLQDVDGFTPLHLLIRRRFQAHILHDESANLMQILEMLVRSCPEAVLIPDRGEYEEPPIVYALKANIYAPALVSDDDTIARVERQIYEMVACMLKYCPEAASQVFTGYRGQYTALHSAVFHGRNTGTIELLLQTEATVRPEGETNCVLANTQGELPLHFCAMRGERPRSVALIANAAPNAVLKRDATGLTPLHWLWARFVSSLLALDRLGDDTTVEDLRVIRDPNANRYSAFASLEQGDFELDLQLIKRMDPPVDFLRMRHIPIDVLGPSDSAQWADLVVELLQYLRERSSGGTEWTSHTWSRRECVVALFWTKVVSLIEASIRATQDVPIGNSVLVHSAFGSPACLPAVARIVACLFPEELAKPDERGRLPIHYAVCRPLHEWDWPRDNNANESAPAQLLRQETLQIIGAALDLSPQHVLTVRDNEGRLPLHDMIDNLCQASMRFPPTRDNVNDILNVLNNVVEQYPASLQCRDGRSKLYPFLQAATAENNHSSGTSSIPTNPAYDLGLSISFQLLRENPFIMMTATSASGNRATRTNT
uniref:Uncharacterized protein n=1 Tax=Entomoneis paludosa TaxID=265537 RepID=A0A6U3C4K4_9STRA|mmetsp:Transcript_32744/g.68272  ORF Transcript_32744/g.68272 Transcript_32744/m.68272 type:complete len:682 (+) Transcript_32744:309-2354(+)|eukprot:CAMPEP_0172475084 /NCGR_PEP_ID=MMETSP1065-20121228/69690_1 /TAXON_ID=265537 /ORGANISM="Amphiprora paludosa, Strain CCMP125" /LENGTH=681 /DNA_ID=CAMNT_0013233277 /DNA_START=195 /DNA_END=2240 /DNA_ORIENTATION=+